MGLFGKKKENKEDLGAVKNQIKSGQQPPAPPTPGQSNQQSGSNTQAPPSAPPSPNQGNQSQGTAPSSSQASNMSMPQPPSMGNSGQQSQAAGQQSQTQQSTQATGQQTQAPSQPQQQQSGSSKKESDENLFDLSDLDLGLENFTQEESKQGSQEATDTQMEDSSFEKPSKNIQDQPVFITTEQFKKVLEHVEFVKNKVKVSSDTYLRLMDIKAEEDIEYENLRKEFQTMEEKLYEIDNILFED